MSGSRWYEAAFGSHYLTVYAHRDEASAESESAFAVEALGLADGDQVLDLACGWGRHSRAMARRGLRVTGLDLSPDLLAEAASRAAPAGEPPRYVRADMRHLPFRRRFRAVTMFFTSFGYFREEADDRRVLEGVAGSLHPGGGILLDYANREPVVRDLVPESRTEKDGVTLEEARRMSDDGLRVLKHVRLLVPGEAVREYDESVRLYDPAEVESLLGDAGFDITGRFGDLAGAPFGPEASRLVLTGRLTC